MSQLLQTVKFANDITVDAAFKIRTSSETRLFDGKILNEDDKYLFDIKGTGTGLFENNTYGMYVSSGQYLVRQSKIYTNYSPGKSHIIEFTWEDFECVTNVEKEIGYNGVITIPAPPAVGADQGRDLSSVPMSQGMSTPSNLLKNDLYSFIGIDIDNTQEEIILCGTPITANVSVACSLIYKEF